MSLQAAATEIVSDRVPVRAAVFLDTRQKVVPSGNDDVGDLNGFGE
jgi:hypothetical protein